MYRIVIFLSFIFLFSCGDEKQELEFDFCDAILTAQSQFMRLDFGVTWMPDSTQVYQVVFTEKSALLEDIVTKKNICDSYGKVTLPFFGFSGQIASP